MSESRKITIPITADATGAKQGFGEVKTAAQDMAQAVQAAGVQASKGVDGIGNGAPAASQKLDTATRSIISSIQRTTAVMKAGEKGSADFYDALGKIRGADVAALKPYTDELRKLEAAQRAATGTLQGSAAGLNAVGASAKQTAAALRGVPAQFTDIVVSLQAGQAPLNVLLQQGGQLRDMFGGIGPAARALGGYVAGLVNPFTLAVGAVAALTVAYVKGGNEAREFQKAIILTGQASGATAGQMQDMAARMAAIAGTQSKAAATLAEFAASGRFARDQLEGMAAAAILFERATGQAVSETVKKFEELAKSPLDATVRLNERQNYLTEAIYRQIKALEEQGRHTEAAKLAISTYAEAQAKAGKQIVENNSFLETSWNTVTTLAQKAWDAMLGVGRDATGSEQLSNLRKQLELREARGPLPGAEAAFEKGNTALRDQIALLERLNGLQAAGAKQQAEQNAQLNARTSWDKAGEEFLTKRERMEREIIKARSGAIAAGATELELEQRIASIREKYKDVDSASVNQYNDLIQRIRERISVADQELKVGRQLTEAEREEARILELISGAKGKLGEADKARIKTVLDEAKAKEILVAVQRGELKTAEEVAKARQALRNTEAEESAAAVRASVQAARDQVRSLEDEAAAAQIAAAQNVTLAEAVQMVTIARLRERQAKLGEDSPLRVDLDNELRLRNEGLQRIAAKAEADRIKDIFASIDTTAQRVWTDVAHGGVSAFKRIGDTLKASVLDVLYQLTIKRWIVNIGAQMSASVMGGVGSLASGAVQGGLSAALGGGGGILGGIGGALGSFGSGFSSGLSGLGGLFGANAAGTTFMGTLDAGFTALGAGNISGGLGTLAGSLGPIAMVAAPIIGSLLKKGGAPKQGGYAGLIGSMGGDNSLGAGIQPVVESYQQQLDSLIRGLGGSASLQLGLGVLTDSKGTAPSFVSGAVSRDGQIIQQATNYNVGRDEASLQAAIQAQMKESLLTALKASDIQGALGDYIKSISDTSQIDAAIARVQKAIAEKQSLEDQLFDLTATDAQKLARSRDQQRAAVDATNRALLEQVFQQQDLKRAADEAKAAFDDLSRTLDSALSSYRTNAVSGIGRGEAFAQIQTALTISQAGGPAPDLAKLKDAISVLSAPSEQAATSLREYVRQRDAEAALLAKLKTQYDVGGAAPAVSAAQAAANQAATTAATTAAMQAMAAELAAVRAEMAEVKRHTKTAADVLDGAATGALYLQTDYSGAGA